MGWRDFYTLLERYGDLDLATEEELAAAAGDSPELVFTARNIALLMWGERRAAPVIVESRAFTAYRYRAFGRTWMVAPPQVLDVGRWTPIFNGEHVRFERAPDVIEMSSVQRLDALSEPVG